MFTVESKILVMIFTDTSLNSTENLNLCLNRYRISTPIRKEQPVFPMYISLSANEFLKNDLVFTIQANEAYLDWKDRKKKKDIFLHLT